MHMPTRAVVAAGLCLVGLACLVTQTLGQQDGAVGRTSNSAAPAARQLPQATIGSIDIETVLKQYEKVKVSQEAFKADWTARQGELNKIMAEGKALAESMEKLTPGSHDYKQSESRMAQLKANLQALKEQSDLEFGQREAESLATFYKDIQEMVARVAVHHHLTYVIRVSKEPVQTMNSELVMAAMSRAVVYFDPTTDITNDVIVYLNGQYRRSTGAGTAGTGAARTPSSTTTPATASPASSRGGSTGTSR